MIISALDDGPEAEKPLRFLLGLAPARLQMGYLVDPSTVDLANRKGPSTIMACQLCAGVAATEALKILLGRGSVRAAPRGYHFDAYRNRLALTWRPGGNRNPLQRLVHRAGQAQAWTDTWPPTPQPIADILELARWAPSGDNTQPWRFEVIDDHHLIVHAFDTRDHCVYDLDGHPSQIAHGALLETLAIAASAHGLRADVQAPTRFAGHAPRLSGGADRRTAALAPDPLLPHIRQRSVQRRPMRTTPLTTAQKQALQDAVGKALHRALVRGRAHSAGAWPG